MSWGAVIVGGSALVGGYVQSRAQSKASRAYGKSADAQSQAIMEMYYGTREDLADYMQAGMGGVQGTEKYMKTGIKGLDKYYNMLQRGPGDFKADPGYEFRLGEGEKQIERLASARGETFSGKTGKALVEYGQEFASNEYGKFMDRYYKKLGGYGEVASMGQTAASNLMQIGQSSAAGVGTAGLSASGRSAGVQMGAAESRASSYINKGDIWGQAVTQGGGILADYASRP